VHFATSVQQIVHEKDYMTTRTIESSLPGDSSFAPANLRIRNQT